MLVVLLVLRCCLVEAARRRHRVLLVSLLVRLVDQHRLRGQQLERQWCEVVVPLRSQEQLRLPRLVLAVRAHRRPRLLQELLRELLR